MRLSLGMIGGGEGAFIGAVHRMASRLDDRWTLVAGAFSSDPVRSQAFGQGLGLDQDRCYGDWQAMARDEAGRPDRIDAVAIVTPRGGRAQRLPPVGTAGVCEGARGGGAAAHGARADERLGERRVGGGVLAAGRERRRGEGGTAWHLAAVGPG